MTESETIRGWLEQSRALRRGHFRLSSGRHSTDYVQCALLLERPERASEIGAALAKCVAVLRPESIVSPALGGLIIGYEVASHCGVPFRFTERKDGKMSLGRGFEMASGERTLIVEDVVTTGRSAVETMEIMRRLGATVVGVGAIIDRSGADVDLGVPLRALERMALETFPPEDCPLCAERVPLETPGSRDLEMSANQPRASR